MIDNQNIALQKLCAVVTVLLIAGLFIAGQTGHVGGLFRPPIDKLAHVGFWFLCTSLAQMASGPNALRRWLVLLLLLLFSALDETVQIWTIGRNAEFADVVANVIGISASSMAGFTIRRLNFNRPADRE
jgi:VanZ family protein